MAKWKRIINALECADNPRFSFDAQDAAINWDTCAIGERAVALEMAKNAPMQRTLAFKLGMDFMKAVQTNELDIANEIHSRIQRLKPSDWTEEVDDLWTHEYYDKHKPEFFLKEYR